VHFPVRMDDGHHRLFTLEAPHRLVIDVFGERPPDRPRPERSPRTLQASLPPKGRLPVASRPVRTVVIDAGHGGKDPGAIGLGGLREKDVNLKLARMLKRRLEARSFNVVMTRDADRFIDLEERTVIAESAKGDVFISIHANASQRRSTRGIEIYDLDENHERHSIELAARENGIHPKQVEGLQRTLAKLRVSEASAHSQKLARIVHHDVITGLDATYRGSPDLGVKKGPFYVLFMSSMSSLLVETGFVTNRDDAKLLRSSAYQRVLAERIAEGIERYRQQVELGLASHSVADGSAGGVQASVVWQSLHAWSSLPWGWAARSSWAAAPSAQSASCASDSRRVTSKVERVE